MGGWDGFGVPAELLAVITAVIALLSRPGGACATVIMACTGFIATKAYDGCACRPGLRIGVYGIVIRRNDGSRGAPARLRHQQLAGRKWFLSVLRMDSFSWKCGPDRTLYA